MHIGVRFVSGRALCSPRLIGCFAENPEKVSTFNEDEFPSGLVMCKSLTEAENEYHEQV